MQTSLHDDILGFAGVAALEFTWVYITNVHVYLYTIFNKVV